jgi:PAS domain S-box-containing protein
LFASAFSGSRNAMLLVDDERRIVDVNVSCLQVLGRARADVAGRRLFEFVVDGPRASEPEWRALLASGQFTGIAEMVRRDGTPVAIQWGACTEVVTGRRLVLFVALGSSRWGRRFRRHVGPDEPGEDLTAREREIVMLVALGSTAREIAEELHISHDTVRTHVRNAMYKLRARSRAQLVAKALAAGLVLDADHATEVSRC